MSDLPNVPDGCQHLSGNMYKVRFQDIVLPESYEPNEEGVSYTFSNPRTMTTKGQQNLADKRLSAELRDSIKSKTLMVPLVCRWIKKGDVFYPQLVGGERRYRALDFLIRKKESVCDPRSPSLTDKGESIYDVAPADEAYEYLNVMVFSTNDDLEALSLAWAENKCRVDLNEGHEIAEVMRLRKYKATDGQILEILQHDAKWLADTDYLVSSLDQNSLSDLIENRITRESAIALLSIKNLTHREKVRKAANAVSEETCENRIRRLENQIEFVEEQVEVAQANLASAEYDDDEDAIEDAQEKLESAEIALKEKVQKRANIAPKTTVADVKKAAKKLTTGNTTDDLTITHKIMSRKNIEGLTAFIDECIHSEMTFDTGRGSEAVVYPEFKQHFEFARMILSKVILSNNENYEKKIYDWLVENDPNN
jgi:hypothetical protein